MDELNARRAESNARRAESNARRAESRRAPRRAISDDTSAIHTLRCELASWLESRGIDQWHPGDVAVTTIAGQVATGQWWVVDDEASVVAAVRMIDHDPATWPDGDRPGAAYVHGLMVGRSAAGQGIGSRLLDWCTDEARRRGADRLRLDCVEHNARLREFYRGRGFEERGRTQFWPPWHSVTLFEKELGG